MINNDNNNNSNNNIFEIHLLINAVLGNMFKRLFLLYSYL